MQTFAAFLGALFGSAFLSGAISAVLSALIFGHRQGDSSGNWSIYPLIVAFYWFFALVLSLIISFPLFRTKFDVQSTATYSGIVSGIISISVALIAQSQNPDLSYYTH